MGAASKYYLRVRESEVSDLPEYLKERMTYIDENDYTGNEIYEAAKSKFIKAKKEFETVKFNLRHNIRP